MFGWLKSWLGIKSPKSAQSAPVARYDAARTDENNRNHWANADGLAPNAANTHEVRRILRNRSRYEDDNNGNFTGLIRECSEDTIGTGPRLQVLGMPDNVARAIEQKWRNWAIATSLTDDLITAIETSIRDGEVFAFMFLNEGIADAVQLALRLYEGDQIHTPLMAADQLVDGIELDRFGNPTFYHVLKQHPGETFLTWTAWMDFDRIPARQMIHLFHRKRPAQGRGVPTLTPSLGTYSILRRYTQASLLSAEAQARIPAVVEQANDLGDEDTNDDAAGEQVTFAGVHMLTLMSGQTAKALPQTNPAPNYAEFKGECLTDAGRPLSAPMNVSTGSSAKYNYSSARLDQQRWMRSIKIRREKVERIILDRLFTKWAEMAILTPGYLPEGLPALESWEWRWRWDGFGSIDPMKDARAASERLENGTTTLDRECSDLGEDWQAVQDQRLVEELREQRRREELGLPPKQPKSPQPTQQPTPQPQPEPEPEEPDSDDE